MDRDVPTEEVLAEMRHLPSVTGANSRANRWAMAGGSDQLARSGGIGEPGILERLTQQWAEDHSRQPTKTPGLHCRIMTPGGSLVRISAIASVPRLSTITAISIAIAAIISPMNTAARNISGGSLGSIDG
jgi:hypothetical protein